MAIISIDLASRRHRDIGVCILRTASGIIHADFVARHEAELSDPPNAIALAEWICTLGQRRNAELIFVDGPQGWKDPMNGLEHGRLCERQLSTPGKTGLPGFVKPASWTRMARFSVNLFDALDAHGYGRVKQRNDLEGRRLVVESFPTSAWRGLRLPALPGKARASADDVALAFSRLSALLPISVSRQPSHDELQALIGGLAGLPFRDYAGVLPTFYGSKPFLLEGIWREGFIINPVLAGASTG